MFDRYAHTRSLYRDVTDRLRAQDLGPDLEDWARGHLRGVRAESDLVLRGDEGYQDFLLAYLTREADKPRKPSAVPDSPYDAHREHPLCTCDYSECHLKHGRLGPRIRHADTIARGIREFQREHDGLPVVLVGLPASEDVVGARDAWSDLCGHVEYVLGTLHDHVARQAGVPEPDPLADPSPETDVSVPLTATPTAGD